MTLGDTFFNNLQLCYAHEGDSWAETLGVPREGELGQDKGSGTETRVPPLRLCLAAFDRDEAMAATIGVLGAREGKVHDGDLSDWPPGSLELSLGELAT